MVSIFKNMDIETNKAIHTISVVTKEDVFYFNANSKVFSNSTVYTSLDNQYSIKLGSRICKGKLVNDLTIMGIPKQNLIEKVIVDNNTEYVLEQHVGNIFNVKEINNIDLTLGFDRDSTSFNNIKNVYSCEEYVSICSRFIQQVRIDGMAIVSLNNYKIAKMIYHSKQVDKETDLITRIEDNRLIVGFLTKNKINDIHELEGYKVYDVIQGKSNHDLLVLHKTGFIHCKVNVKGIEIVNNLDSLFVLEDSKDYLITLNMNTFGFSEVTSSDSFITFEGKSFEELSVMLSDLDPEKLKLKDRDSIKALKMLINDSKQVVNVLKMSGFLGDNDNSKDSPFCLEPKNLEDIKYSFELAGKEIHLLVDESVSKIENTTQESLLDLEVKGKEVNDLVEATNKELIQSIEVFKDNLKELDREYKDKEKSLEQVIKEANFAYVRLTSKIDSAEDYISNFNKKLDISLALADQKLETNLTNFSKEVDDFIKGVIKDLENTVEGLLDKFYSDLDLFYEDKVNVELLIEETLKDLENLNKEYSTNLLELKNKYVKDLDDKNTESLAQIEESKNSSIDSINLEKEEALGVIKNSTQGVVDLVEHNVSISEEHANNTEKLYNDTEKLLEDSESIINSYTQSNIENIDSFVSNKYALLDSKDSEVKESIVLANNILEENKNIETILTTLHGEHVNDLLENKNNILLELGEEKNKLSKDLVDVKEDLEQNLSGDFVHNERIEDVLTEIEGKIPSSVAVSKALKNVDLSSYATKKYVHDNIPQYHISTQGNMKEYGPILKLFSNGVEANELFTSEPVFNKENVGVYKISNTSGLSSKGWFIETPKDINGLPIYYVRYEQNAEKEVTIYVYNTIKHNPETLQWEYSGLVDIDERLGWIDLRFDS